MRGEQAIFNLEIKKKSGLSLNPDIHHSKVFSSECLVKNQQSWTFEQFFLTVNKRLEKSLCSGHKAKTG